MNVIKEFLGKNTRSTGMYKTIHEDARMDLTTKLQIRGILK
jgi:hypothetical protein